MLPNFRKAARKAVDTVVFNSSLIQCPLLGSAFAEDAPILIITAWESGSVQRDAMMAQSGFVVDQTRFLVAQFSQLSGFDHVPVGGDFEYKRIFPELVALGKEWLAKYPDIRAIILESTEMTPYADVMRAELEVPVYDVVTACDFYVSARELYPRPATQAPRVTLGMLDIGDASGATESRESCILSPDVEVKCRHVPGLDIAMCEGGRMTAEARLALTAALVWFEANGIEAITGSSSFLLRFQSQIRLFTKLPVFMSPLTALPLVQGLYEPTEKVLIISANAATFERMKDTWLGDLGAAVDKERCVVVGVEGLPDGHMIEAGTPAVSDLFEKELLKLVQDAFEAAPEIRAVLVEAVALVPHSNALRKALGLPVFDATTICDYFHSAGKDNPRFGINDWRSNS